MPFTSLAVEESLFRIVGNDRAVNVSAESVLALTLFLAPVIPHIGRHAGWAWQLNILSYSNYISPAIAGRHGSTRRHLQRLWSFSIDYDRFLIPLLYCQELYGCGSSDDQVGRFGHFIVRVYYLGLLQMNIIAVNSLTLVIFVL